MNKTRNCVGAATAVAIALLMQPGVAAADLTAAALAGWARYVGALEHRRADEGRDPTRFLATDFTADAAADRRTVLAGSMAIHRMDTPQGSGPAVDVPNAIVHHWRGVILLPGVSLARLMATLQTTAPPVGPDVLRAAVLSRGTDTMRVFLRIQRTRFVTVVFDTEHEIRFTRLAPGRAASTSVAVRVAELADAGTPAEHVLGPNDDHGFLWRLNAYWRYEAVTGGVIAECESISLSRDIPFGVQYVAAPLIRRAARESMERTLDQVRMFATSVAP